MTQRHRRRAAGRTLPSATLRERSAALTAQPSVQLYSVRAALAEEFDRTIDRLVEMGVREIEPYAFPARTGDYLRALRATGITAPSGHASVIEAESPDAVFEAARELGMGTVIDPFAPPDRWQAEGEVERLAERVNELGARAASLGLRFGYHNHAHELRSQIDGRHALEVFAEHLEPGIVLEVDAYWAAVGGADTLALLRRLAERVELLHVKDGTLDGDPQKQEPLGRGELDLPPMLQAVPGARRVIEFDAYAGDIFGGVSESLAWLREHDR